MKTMLLPVLALLLATGCVSQAQKDEIALLKEIHKAERQISSGKFDTLVGSGIVASGQLKIAMGKKAREQAIQQLQDGLDEGAVDP